MIIELSFKDTTIFVFKLAIPLELILVKTPSVNNLSLFPFLLVNIIILA